MRVFPNLYPAFARQEVVVHSPEHLRSVAELGEEQLALVAEAWRLRREAEPAGYLHALVNEGREAGASRLPYELVLAPAEPRAGAFVDPLLPAALVLLGEAVRRLRATDPEVPLNAWLHDSDDWHLEVLPRRAVLAGIELGAGIYVNAVPPEDAAARLRAS